MVNFYRKEDINESTFIRADRSFRIPDDIADTFLEDTNQWYTELAIDYGVAEDEIALFVPPNIENRNSQMVKLAQYYFFKEVFFSLSNEKDDIYWIKYLDTEKKFEKQLGKVSIEKILGLSPSSVKTQSTFGTIRFLRS